VAGVLIALAGDRFVQGLEDEALETAYLGRLLTEFEGAHGALSGAALWAEQRQQSAETFLQVASGHASDSLSTREIVLAMALPYWVFDPEVPRETWDDLVATGRMSLIESESLRTNISTFYGRIAQQSEFHGDWLVDVRPYQREVTRILSPQLQLGVAQYRIDGVPIPEELLPDRDALIASIRNRPELTETVGEALVTGWAGVRQYRALAEQAEGIAAQIRLELESDS